ncbi:unnamed protein product [Schistosoma curassoni]|uniref:Miff domain-containing protein n=1 Tax=Schistosoma curassoni TaxID=6186 RepID=A0A183KP98_9TREM|nr:unnamed protein product [Schistosoma curassoni]
MSIDLDGLNVCYDSPAVTYLDDLIDNLDPVPLQHALDPLPTSLVLNEVHYPDLERLTIEKREIETAISTPLLLTNESQNHIPTEQQPSPLPLSNISNVINHSSTTISSSPSSSSMNQTNNTQSIVVDTRRLRLLEIRMNEIELELSRRQFMDKLLYITFGGYFVLKCLRLLFS